MKLSNAFESRIVIDQNNKYLDHVDASMAFLNSLSLDPPTEKKIATLNTTWHQLEYKYAPPKIAEQKARFYYEAIIPMLKKIAPEGCFFGHHPKDDNLIGFWCNNLKP